MNEIKMKEIIRDRDEDGHILTYSVDMGFMVMRFNTLRKAKIMAMEVD